MFCFSITTRNTFNIWDENQICTICFTLQEVVIGYDKHFIVHEENYINLVDICRIYDLFIVESLDFEVLELVSELGTVIIIGNTYINCDGMTLVK